MTVGVYGIYYHNECLYVGQSVNIDYRFNSHKRMLVNNSHHCASLQDYFNSVILKIENLDFVVIEETSRDRLTFYEKKYFESHKPKFWGRVPADSYLFSDLSQESKEKIYSLRKEKSKVKTEFYLTHYKDSVIALYKSKRTMEQISEELMIPYSRVRNILKGSNVIIRQNKDNLAPEWRKGKTDSELKGLISRARDESNSWEEAARKLGASTTSLRTTAESLGLLKANNPYNVHNFFEDYGKEIIRDFLLKEYIYGSYTALDVAQHFNVSRKNVLSAIRLLELDKLVDGKELANRKLSLRRSKNV